LRNDAAGDLMDLPRLGFVKCAGADLVVDL
jgi:hypothetical protein